MANLAEYVAAAIAVHIRRSNGSAFLSQADYDGVREALSQVYEVKIPIDVVKDALKYLDDCGISTVVSDPYTRDHFAIDEGANDNFVNSYNDLSTPFGKACRLGMPWISEALKNIADREFSSEQEFEDVDWEERSNIPASDRLVKLSDNQSEAEQLVHGLERLTAEIRSTNDANERLAERDRIITEIDAGVRLLSAPSVRVRALWAVLAPALLFLASSFSESVIGSLASDLYAAMKSLLGL